MTLSKNEPKHKQK